MANLIEQLQNLTVNEIKLEVALLKEINIVNAAKETGNRMMGALAKAATSIALVMLMIAFVILFINAILQSRTSKIVSGRKIR